MPRKARAHPKPERRPTLIRAWRKHRGYSQARVSEMLLNLEGLEMSEAQLSRIENGKQPYSQDFLEALSRVLQCDVADLLMRDPSAPGSIWTIWENATKVEREEAQAYIETRRRMTGTDNS